jgi:protein SCO1
MSNTRPAPNPSEDAPSLRRLLRHLGVMLAIVAVVLVIGITAIALNRPRNTEIAIGGPFSLIDSHGQPVTNKSWPGKYLLVYFGYTSCPDVCPTTLSDVAGALASLGSRADRIQPVFITVDPKRDTPGVLAGYTSLFSPRLVGLTGSPDAIAKAAKEYRVYYAEHRTGPGPNDYAMDHSSTLYLMAPDGHFITTIRAEQQPAAMASDIASHLA